MATKNIHLAKHLDGSRVELKDLKLGLELRFPSGTGGTLRHTCVKVDGSVYTFKSTSKDWPSTFAIEDGVPDFTYEDFQSLSDALCAYSKPFETPTSEQVALVRRAASLGYASVLSHTQVAWTDEGINRFADLTPDPSPESVIRDQLEAQVRQAIPTELYYDMLDVMGDYSDDQLRALIAQHEAA